MQKWAENKHFMTDVTTSFVSDHKKEKKKRKREMTCTPPEISNTLCGTEIEPLARQKIKASGSVSQEAACFLSHLQIEVGDLFTVHEADTFQNLLQEVDGLVLRQVLLRSDEVEKLSTLDTKPQTDTWYDKAP